MPNVLFKTTNAEAPKNIDYPHRWSSGGLTAGRTLI